MADMLEISVEINEMEVYGYHGMTDLEQTVGNRFLVTVHMKLAAHQAAVYDELSGTVNYAEIVEIIKLANNTPTQLIEHFAWRIYRMLMRRYPKILAGMVKVEKLNPPMEAQLRSAASVIEW